MNNEPEKPVRPSFSGSLSAEGEPHIGSTYSICNKITSENISQTEMKGDKIIVATIHDDYGRTQNDPDFGSRSEVPEPYITDASVEEVVYACFEDTPVRCVRRITRTDGITTTEFSIGNWTEREALVYQPVNTAMEVPE